MRMLLNSALISLFLSTPSARRATSNLSSGVGGAGNFYPRPPRGGRPAFRDSLTITNKISIHALREEGDSFLEKVLSGFVLFLSTPSARRATQTQRLGDTDGADFYPRPPRGGRPPGMPCVSQWVGISIHALREEGDHLCDGIYHHLHHFYPRPPRGGRHAKYFKGKEYIKFLSTPSARRATNVDYGAKVGFLFLSTPSARRATEILTNFFGTDIIFLSTPSARRATGAVPRAARPQLYFYPRPPRGGRPQPALPPRSCGSYFYPRPPRGGRQVGLGVRTSRIVISIHALREEGDVHKGHPRRSLSISIHALREEGDVNVILQFGHLIHFYPRPPRGGRHHTFSILSRGF